MTLRRLAHALRKIKVFVHRDEEKICRRSRLSKGRPCNMFVDIQEGL